MRQKSVDRALTVAVVRRLPTASRLIPQCILTTTVYMGSSIVSPATLLISAQFGVSTVAATLPLSLFVAGYAVGPLILAPVRAHGSTLR